MSESEELSREECLIRILKRMQDHDIFYQDIWDRLLETPTEVLREIEASNFEREVLKMRGTN